MFHDLTQVCRHPLVAWHALDYRLACTDAYLTPCLKRYIDTFSNAFENDKLNKLNVLFMQSDGGLTPVDK